MNALRGSILTPQGWITGQVSYGERIVSIEAMPVAGPLRHIIPGFIDLHVHGASDVDIMAGGNSGEVVARTHARHGTTSMLGTTMTARIALIEQALQGLAGVIAERRPGCARMLGVHLEGPFISAQRLGAQPPEVMQATLDKVKRLHGIAPIRVLTLAPEITGHLELISELNKLGIRVQVGHSAGTYEDGVAALNAGAAGFTHLFNGMTGLKHREPGMAGAALAHAEYAELIPDLEHVHPGAMRVALRSIPKLYCVSDATAATGMPDGEYSLGTQRVFKCLGCVRLATGSLAGSALTMDMALRNLVSIGLDLADASHRLSRNPADYLGETARGRIAPQAFADLVVLDEQLQVTQVLVEGEPIDFQS